MVTGRDRVGRRTAGVVVGCLGLVGCAAGGGSGLPPTTTPEVGGPRVGSGVVAEVIDGDTIDVAGIGRIRLIGLDTPERGACGYESASQALAVRVLGREVALVAGAGDDVDRYGRLLRYVDIAGVDAGLALIEDGWAIARYDSRDGYGRHAREDTYVAADAASPDLGCYPDDEPVP